MLINSENCKSSGLLSQFRLRLLLAVGITVLLLVKSSSAEVFKPVQIFFPGNFQGQLSELMPDLQFHESAAWKIPDTIDSFKRDRSKTSIVYAIGNDSDFFVPLSYFTQGQLERDLIARCNPAVTAVSAADIEVLNSNVINRGFRQRLFTNLDSDDKSPMFKPFMQQKFDGIDFWFFNFIEPDLCRNLQSMVFGTDTIDDPVRALNRLNPGLGPESFSISTVYGDFAMFERIAGEFRRRPGIHFLIQVPMSGQQTPLSNYNPTRSENVFMMTFAPGNRFLPMLNIIRKTHGFPRLTLRMLPLTKTSSINARHWHRDAIQALKPGLFETLRVIPTTSGSSTSARRFNPQAHAHIIRLSASTDIAITLPPDFRHLPDNVVTTAQLLTCMPNDRVQRFRLSGAELQSLAELLVKEHGMSALAFSGCDFSVLGGQLREMLISKQPIAAEKIYSIAATDTTMRDHVMKNFLAGRTVERYDGNCVWNCWKTILKTVRISDSNLFE